MPNVKNKNISLNNLYLDNDNPRHDPISAEPEIIAQLVSKEKISKLAADLAKHGLNPLSRIAAIRHPTQKGKYTVVEGNRRLCALKLLLDPKRAPTPASRKTFESLQKEALPTPKQVDVSIFEDRESARHWLSVQHEGEQDGVGTRNWKAPEKTRFNAQGSPVPNPNVQALALLDYAETQGTIELPAREKISITTVSRYLSNPVVRSTFGLTNNKDLDIDVPQDEFDKVISQFLQDASIGKKVHSRSNSEERKKYALSLQRQKIAPTTRLPSSTAPKPSSQKKKRPRGSPHPDKRKFIVPSDFTVQKKKDTVLLRIFHELKSIDPEDFKFAGAYLLRAFIEQVATKYAKQKGRDPKGKKFHDVIIICIDELTKEGHSKKQLKPLSMMTASRHSLNSPDTLGAWIHGSLIPTPSELKARWDELSPWLRVMVDQIK